MSVTRKGKIARLPREIREQLNRRLDDRQEGQAVVDWLNGLPAVLAVLAAEFGGEPVSEINLSRWRQARYVDWVTHQDAPAEIGCFLGEAGELELATLGPLSDRLALLATTRYALAARRLGREGADEDKDWKLLRELCYDLVALRRGDQGAARVRIEQERLGVQRETAKHKQASGGW